MSSIEKRKHGSREVWRVRYRDNGHNRAMTFESEETAVKWRNQLETLGLSVALAILDQDQTNSITLGEHLESHITRLTGVTDGTKKSYRSYVKRDMADIAQIPVVLVNHEAVARWINRLADQGLSGKSIANRHGLLSAAMNTAVADKIAIDNPCRGMRLPQTSHQGTEMTFLTVDEFDDLFELIPQHFQPLVLTLVGTGMRFGEATALQVRDVNLATNSIHIRQAWKMTGLAKKELGPPKTKRSIRTVAMPGEVASALAPLLENRAAKDFVFTNHVGEPVLQATFWRNTWSPAVQKFAGDEIRIDHDKDGRKIRVVTKEGPGKHLRIHDLRHTFVSWAMADGQPLPIIQGQLGHESITTTIGTYGHLARADFDALAIATNTRLPKIKAIEG